MFDTDPAPALRRAIAACAALALAGCGQHTDPTDPNAAGLSVAPPAELMQMRALDRDRLSLDARLDGRTLGVVRRGDVWEISTTVRAGVPVRLELDWTVLRTATGQNLLLADYDETTSFERATELELTLADFDVSHDDDSDGTSNLDELVLGFDPQNRNLCPDCRTDVDMIVPWVPAAAGVVIDGGFDQGIWNGAQFKDRSGDLDLDAGEGEVSRATPGDRRWAAMHDGNFLYLFVFGEGPDKTHHFDSEDPSEDDAVAITVSGTATSLGTMRLVVPVRSAAGNANRDERARLEGEGELAELLASGALAFATCICDRSFDAYEVRIALAYLGLGSGERFSIDVRLVDDVDGGEADLAWRWPGAAPDFEQSVALE